MRKYVSWFFSDHCECFYTLSDVIFWVKQMIDALLSGHNICGLETGKHQIILKFIFKLWVCHRLLLAAS